MAAPSPRAAVMTATTDSDSKANSAVVLMAIGAFALGMASYITAGLIPMMQTQFSISLALSAQLVTAFTLAYGIGSPVVVAMLPSHWQRQGLLASLIIFVIGNVVSALAPTFTWLMLSRVIAGVGAGVYLAMAIAASASIVSSHARGKAIAWMMTGMAAGTVLGVPIGLVLAQRYGWPSAMWLVAALGLLAWLGLLWRLPPLPARQAVRIWDKWVLLRHRRVLMILMVSLLAATASLGMYTFIAGLLESAQFGAVNSIAPWLWVWGLGGIVGSLLVGRLTDRLRGSLLSLVIMVMLALALFILPWVAALNVWLAMLPIAVWGAVGWALQVPQNNQLLVQRQEHGDGDLAIALNESALYLGGAIGAALGGLLLLWQWPIGALPIAAAVVAGCGALVQLSIYRLDKKKQ